jgi:hypothetical protein
MVIGKKGLFTFGRSRDEVLLLVIIVLLKEKESAGKLPARTSLQLVIKKHDAIAHKTTMGKRGCEDATSSCQEFDSL